MYVCRSWVHTVLTLSTSETWDAWRATLPLPLEDCTYTSWLGPHVLTPLIPMCMSVKMVAAQAQTFTRRANNVELPMVS